MTLTDFEARCEQVRRKAFSKGPGFVARCPACADSKSQHLSVCEKGDGFIHLNCQKGHTEEEILSALGLMQSDRRIEEAVTHGRPARPAEVEYSYVDDQGSQLFIKRRYSEWDGSGWKKNFVQVMPDGSYGVTQKLNGKSKTLYNLPAVREAIRKGNPIYLNEGEKACDALGDKGVVATCQPGGANERPEAVWLPQHTEALRGARLVRIVADRDAAGETYAAYVAAQLSGVVVKVEVVQSAVTLPKADAYDHLAAGKDLSDFIPRPDLMPKRGFSVKSCVQDFKPVEIQHLVYPYLPAGKCVLLDADGGTGKTTMALAWAAALSRGLHPLTFERLETGPVKTLYLHKGEDSDEELETVYRANDGVPGMLMFLNECDAARLKFDAEGLRLVQETIEDTGVGLIVVDALFYFLEGVVGDSYKAMDAVGVLTGLNRVASRTGSTFMNIRHTSKGTVGTAASNLGMGSVQFRNSHRGQLVARWHPEKKGVVVVTDEKGSLLNARGDHFMYRRVDMEVQYLRGQQNPFDRSEAEAKHGGKLKEAKDALRSMLTGQYVPVAMVMSEMEALGISKRTVETARAELGVKPIKAGAADGWMLHLPIPEEEDPFEQS